MLPALKFGALFTLILFAGRAAAATVGGASAYWTSAFGGFVDVDAIAVTLSDLVHGGQIPLRAAVIGVVLAWAANAVLKTILAASAGSVAFGWRVAAGFVTMFAAAAVALWMG